MVEPTTAAGHAKEARRNVIQSLDFAMQYLNEAAEWMVTDAEVNDDDASIVAEFSIRIRGLLRKYDPDYLNPPPAVEVEPTHVRVIALPPDGDG